MERDWTGWRRRVGREEGALSRSAGAGGLAFISALGGLGGLALTAHGDLRARTLGWWPRERPRASSLMSRPGPLVLAVARFVNDTSTERGCV